MPPEVPNSSTSGADSAAPEPRVQSIRDVAEAAYDEISGQQPDDVAAAEPPQEGDGQPRDARGRFVPKEPAQEPGEAEAEPPSPEKSVETKPAQPDPAAQQRASNQPPEHWSAEDKATFARAPQDVRDMFLRRHQEMEADYTRKSQANASAVQAVNQLAPIFRDPDISRSMQEMQVTPMQAIHDWARLHKGAVSANPRDRASILYEIAERMGFDPAKVFASNRQPASQPPPEIKDPVARHYADLAGRTNSDLQALRAELLQFKQAAQEKADDEALRATRWSIDNFADEKGRDGKPLRPYFDRVLNTVIEMFRANPERDLQQAYEAACWQDPEVRAEMLRAEYSRVQQGAANQRAAQAARSNVRGLTSPVSKPAPERKGNGSLRDALEASADEVGF